VGAPELNRSDARRPAEQTVAGPGRPFPPALLWLLTVSTGLVIANLYYLQPLLGSLAARFRTDAQTAGLVATLMQLGYAAGLALIVPLGDLHDRRKLIVTLLTLSALVLGGVAAAPVLPLFAVAAALVGVCSVAAQVLVPFAASLASDSERGRVVGTVMSGLLIGILLARTVSGLVAGRLGLPALYLLASLLTLTLAGVLWRALPRDPRPAPSLTYGELLASTLALLREEPRLRQRSLYGALGFAAFSVFWTGLALLLSGAPYRYTPEMIGLFGLVGAAGALAASWAGRLADAGYAARSTLGFSLCVLLAYLTLLPGGTSLLALLLGVVLLDLGVQGLHITNQSEVYRLRPEARARITTVYLTSYFLGGSLGSAAASVAFQRGGWLALCGCGLVCGAGLLLLQARAAWQTAPSQR
jgi:predicted MFS family arabinose efflux permease